MASRSKEFMFTKFFGISPPELIVLACLNEYIGQGINTRMNVDAFFLRLKMKGFPIDLEFDDNIFPFSSHLHEMLFSFGRNRIIDFEHGYTLTRKGHILIDEFMRVNGDKLDLAEIRASMNG